MSPYRVNAGWAWQESWDRQQEAYLPDREERFTAMFNTVDAATGGRPATILDLAGGTGSISLRALRRFPEATTTLLDLDPVLLTIARSSVDNRTTVVSADLRTPQWRDALPHGQYDAVLTATALHWLAADRLAELYREICGLLKPGGVFVNADHMPDDGLPGLSEKFGAREDARREARYVAGAVLSWEAWWAHVAADPTLGPLVEQRRQLFDALHSTGATPPLSWHLDALRDAGFAEWGITWRDARDAALTGVR